MPDLCRKHRIVERAFYNWKPKYGELTAGANGFTAEGGAKKKAYWPVDQSANLRMALMLFEPLPPERANSRIKALPSVTSETLADPVAAVITGASSASLAARAQR